MNLKLFQTMNLFYKKQLKIRIIFIFFILTMTSLVFGDITIENIQNDLVYATKKTSQPYKEGDIFDVYANKEVINKRSIYINFIDSLHLVTIKKDKLILKSVWKGGETVLKKGYFLTSTKRFLEKKKELKSPNKENNKKVLKNKKTYVECSLLINGGFVVMPIGNKSLLEISEGEKSAPPFNNLPGITTENNYSGLLIDSLDFLIRIKPFFIGLRLSVGSIFYYRPTYQIDENLETTLHHTKSLDYIISAANDIIIPLYNKGNTKIYYYFGLGIGLKNFFNESYQQGLSLITEGGIVLTYYNFHLGSNIRSVDTLKNFENILNYRFNISVGIKISN